VDGWPAWWPLPDVAQTVYLTLQAVLGLETLWQWPLEMYETVPNVSHQSARGKGVITRTSPPPVSSPLLAMGGPRPLPPIALPGHRQRNFHVLLELKTYIHSFSHDAHSCIRIRGPDGGDHEAMRTSCDIRRRASDDDGHGRHPPFLRR
jgi:hypothetical protein